MYKLLQRGASSTSVAYLYLQYEFKLLQVFRYSRRKKNFARHRGALIGKREMSLDVASQCKANGIIEIFVLVLVTSRQKYLLADRSTRGEGGTIGRLGDFEMNDVGWRPQPTSSSRYTE